MNKFLILQLFLACVHLLFGQTKISKQEASHIIDAVLNGNDYSKKLYDLGNIEFSKKNYDRADSLFTESVKLVPHPDTYYNRAVCKKRMNDFGGYCTDLAAAANLKDVESYRLYCKECAKIDTLFLNALNEPATIKDFDIAIFTTNFKYNTNSEYEKYDNEGNILLSYIIMGNDTIYLKSKDVKEASYNGGNKAIEDFIKTKTTFYEHINKNKLSGKVNLALTIGSNGKIRRVKVLLGLRDGSSDSLAKALYKLEAFQPAKYNNRDAKFQQQISVDFNYNSLIVYDKLPNNKIYNLKLSMPDSIKETFAKVEEMPEFPGGAIEMMKFIQKNIKYPTSLNDSGIKGKCYLRFIVGADGNIYNVEVLKGVNMCPECDSEAVRVVKSMPKWKPGSQNGHSVSVFFNLPINFERR